MHVRLLSSAFFLPIGAALSLMPLCATTITTYSNLASWQASTSAGYKTVTFTGLTPLGTDTIYSGPSGVAASGVEFIGYNSAGLSDIEVVDTSSFPQYNWDTGDALLQTMNRPGPCSPLPRIDIVLPANITSLSLNLFTTNPEALSYTITVAGKQYTVPTSSQPTLAFWGITSTAPITSLQLTLQGTSFRGSSQALLDNFRFGAADLTAAPEAGTWVLIGSGLIGLIALRKSVTSEKTDGMRRRGSGTGISRTASVKTCSSFGINTSARS